MPWVLFSDPSTILNNPVNPVKSCEIPPFANGACVDTTPQPASSYGNLADQANGMLAGGLKVDGALTLLSLNSLMEQGRRTGHGVVTHVSPALIGTPLSQGIGGSFVRRTIMDWVEVAGTKTAKGGYERDYIYTAVDVWCWVPGGNSFDKLYIPQNPKPQPVPTSISNNSDKIHPPDKSICPPWNEQTGELVRVFNGLLNKAIPGLEYKNMSADPMRSDWQVVLPNVWPPYTYEESVLAFKRNGWSWTFDLHWDHWRGNDYEKYHNGGWYHLTIGYNTQIPSWSPKRVSWITIHCENDFRNSSLLHRMNYFIKNIQKYLLN